MINKIIVTVPVPDHITGDFKMADSTSLVMDKDEFDTLVDLIVSDLTSTVVANCPGQEVGNWGWAFKRSNIIPLVKRGTKTQILFDKYEITTDYLSAIVRGTGKELLEQAIVAANASNN